MELDSPVYPQAILTHNIAELYHHYLGQHVQTAEEICSRLPWYISTLGNSSEQAELISPTPPALPGSS